MSDSPGVGPHVSAPEGYQWVLAPQRPTYPRQDELPPFADHSIKKEFEYDRLSSMRKRIRLLRLFSGQRDSDPTCELFEAEIMPALGEVHKVVNGQTTGEIIEYEALSWSWGTDPPDSRILIRLPDGKTKMKAAPALVWALKYLMRSDQDRILWVDAICIDQSSVDEKNHQVQMMSQIYSYAARVCVWLGRESTYSQTAIRFIKEDILKLHQFDELCSNKANAEKWQSLLRLMQRPWFFRRWVVQEIALAKDAEIYCGPDRLAWKDFSVAVELFVEVESATHRLSEVMQKDPRFYHVPGWFEYVSFLGASLLVEATGMVFRTYDKPSGGTLDPIALRRPLLSLEYLVSKLSIFRASEPRDAIYALLAIANDGYPAANATRETESLALIADTLSDYGDQKPFPVNYGHPYNDVCQDFIQFCVDRSTDRSRALDILCRPWAPEPRTNTSIYEVKKKRSADMVARIEKEKDVHNRLLEENPSRRIKWELMEKYFPPPTRAAEAVPALPSWIPKDSGAPYEMFQQPGIHNITKLGRKNADPLVAPPTRTRNYDAAQGISIHSDDFRFRKRRQQGVHSMFVRGFVLTEIEHTTDASQSGNIPEEWFKVAGWTPTSSAAGSDAATEPPEAFWRTLVADRGKDGRNPPYYYSRACKESVKKGGYVSGAVNTADLINNERNSIVAQFCRRVQAVIWNRQLVKTKLGNLGIARKDVAKGDLVCILYGCSVPVVLRKHVKAGHKKQNEEEEDEKFPLLEKYAQEKYIRRFIRNSKLRRKWELRPNVVSEKDIAAGWRFGKEEVREDIRRWRERRAKMLDKDHHELPCRRREDGPDRLASHSAKQKDKPELSCVEHRPEYYEFLGECYIHGMMDGEAVRQKTEQNKERRTDPREPALVGLVRSVTSLSPPQRAQLPRRATNGDVAAPSRHAQSGSSHEVGADATSQFASTDTKREQPPVPPRLSSGRITPVVAASSPATPTTSNSQGHGQRAAAAGRSQSPGNPAGATLAGSDEKDSKALEEEDTTTNGVPRLHDLVFELR
ncbi:heterokaryon incompatibility protein-domain-containing protein [Microdochium bolleyi]|uniref:Heterokaryon incompatibility protein-domain-containing protein n=1 Tax=Microdochium bolleyi TaxID=196109 RepID=A0A136JDD5_9PEZI|nr:heterokaryon incompatibility protein-domain-containing protein [Microdochium bolleyi]